VAERTTFIKLDRNIIRWKWYQNANTMRVFLHLMLTANIRENQFETVTVHRGETVISYPSLARALKITEDQARTAIAHLKSTGEITARQYSKFQVVTLVSYDYYQGKIPGSDPAKSQSSTSQVPVKSQHLKNNKNNKNNKKGDGTPKSQPADGSASPPAGERPPAIGGKGDCYLEIDGNLHRFPKEWYGYAKSGGTSIEDYVRMRHQ